VIESNPTNLLEKKKTSLPLIWGLFTQQAMFLKKKTFNAFTLVGPPVWGAERTKSFDFKKKLYKKMVNSKDPVEQIHSSI